MMKMEVKNWNIAVLIGGLAVSGAVLVQPSTEAHAATPKYCLEQWKEPKVKMDFRDPKVKLNLTKSKDQLTSLVRKQKWYSHRHNTKVNGIAVVQVGWNMNFRYRTTELPDGRICARVTEVSVKFNYKKKEIYVARKYKPGTCHYKAVLDHEREHMTINDRVKDRYEKKLVAYLKRDVRQIDPFVSKSKKAAGEKIKSMIGGDIRKILSTFPAERKNANQKIDTNASYKRVHQKCANW